MVSYQTMLFLETAIYGLWFECTKTKSQIPTEISVMIFYLQSLQPVIDHLRNGLVRKPFTRCN